MNLYRVGVKHGVLPWSWDEYARTPLHIVGAMFGLDEYQVQPTAEEQAALEAFRAAQAYRPQRRVVPPDGTVTATVPGDDG